jgi:hypothetical protein
MGERKDGKSGNHHFFFDVKIRVIPLGYAVDDFTASIELAKRTAVFSCSSLDESNGGK